MNQDATALPTASPAAGTHATPPWGFWATLAWAVLAVCLSFLGGMVFWANCCEVATAPAVYVNAWFPLLLIGVNAVQIVVAVVAAQLAWWPVGPYLGLNRPRGRDLLLGIAATIAVLLALELLTYVLGKPHVSSFQVDTYEAARAAGTLPLLWLAFAILIPISEEILFRGFVFRGWEASRLGGPGTIILTSLIFAVGHIQYDWFGIFQTFCMGVLFGWLRWRSGSTTLTIVLHMLINFVATAWTALKVAGMVS